MQLYDRFSKEYHGCDLNGKIGIITPYKAQLYELRDRFKRRYGETITNIIEFNPTDAFQGRECEIIIFSRVRASSTGGIGFMTDIRRMNVGLTRAKSSLWILGDSRALVQGEFWKKSIDDAQVRDRYTKGDILAGNRPPVPLTKPRPVYTPADSSLPCGWFLMCLATRPEHERALFAAFYGKRNPRTRQNCARSFETNVSVDGEHILYPFHACVSLNGLGGGKCSNRIWHARSDCVWGGLENYRSDRKEHGSIDRPLKGQDMPDDKREVVIIDYLNPLSAPRITRDLPRHEHTNKGRSEAIEDACMVADAALADSFHPY